MVVELDGMNEGGTGPFSQGFDILPVIRKYTWGLDLSGQGGNQSRDRVEDSLWREGAGSCLHGAGCTLDTLPSPRDLCDFVAPSRPGQLGGLLAVEDTNGTPSDDSDDLRYLSFHDANGNVGQLVGWSPIADWQTLELSGPDAWHGSRLAARYEYDAYGNALLDPADAEASGPYADANPYRFSTKHLDDESGQYYYGYRYLDTALGR